MKLSFTFLLFAFCISAYAQPRFLDSTFGDNGKVVTDFGSEEAINSIAFQSNKKIVAAGYYDLIKKNISFNFLACALARYQTNGKLDSSFGKNGFIYFDGRYSEIVAIVTQQNDKITGTGNADAYGGQREELVVLQWKQNGELDSSFGENGVAPYGSYPLNSLGKA